MERRRAILSGLLLVALCAPIYLYRLGGPGLADPDEGRNAEVAREMLVTGDWVTPHINDARYLDKPPAFFWAVAGALRIFGVNEWGARLPSAFCALLGIALVFWFGRRHLGVAAGWLAAGMLALSPLYIVFGRIVIFDMMLTLCMTASALAAYEAMREDGGGGRLGGPIFFAAAACGTIVKGPVALVVPLLVAIAWATVRRRPGLLLRLRFGRGLLIYAAIVLPWLALVSWRNPGFLEYALLGENLERMLSNKFETARPFWFYLTVLPPGLFPWIIYPGVAAIRRLAGAARGAARSAPGEPQGDGARYAAVWLGTLIVFFSLIVSKRPSYVLPCAVPTALLAGHLWAAAFAGRRAADRAPGGGRAPSAAQGDLRAGSIVVAGVCALMAIAVALVGPGGVRFGFDDPRFAGILDRGMLFGATAAGLVLAAVAIVATRRSARPAVVFAAATLSVAVLVPLTRVAGGQIDALRSSRAMSRLLASRLGPDDKVICFEEYRPGLNFYLRRPIYQVTRAGRIFTSNYIAMRLDEYQGQASFRLIPQEELRRLLHAEGPPVYVLSPRKEYPALLMLTGVPLDPIYEDAVATLYVRPPGEG